MIFDYFSITVSFIAVVFVVLVILLENRSQSNDPMSRTKQQN